MRKDMYKVVVERERYGSDLGYHFARSTRKNDLSDEAPLREGIKRPHVKMSKSLNENLSPLRRFLRSRVGQPWDKVYSEISEHIRASNPVQQHVRDHLDGYVHFNVVMKNGRWEEAIGRWFRGLRQGDLFVDPHGVLRAIKHTKTKQQREPGWRPYVISSLTERTSHRRHVKSYKTTYYLHRQKDYKPMSGEVVVETVHAANYEAAFEYFQKNYPQNPSSSASNSPRGNCRCLECAAYRAEYYARLAAVKEQELSSSKQMAEAG